MFQQLILRASMRFFNNSVPYKQLIVAMFSDKNYFFDFGYDFFISCTENNFELIKKNQKNLVTFEFCVISYWDHFRRYNCWEYNSSYLNSICAGTDTRDDRVYGQWTVSSAHHQPREKKTLCALSKHKTEKTSRCSTI